MESAHHSLSRPVIATILQMSLLFFCALLSQQSHLFLICAVWRTNDSRKVLHKISLNSRDCQCKWLLVSSSAPRTFASSFPFPEKFLFYTDMTGSIGWPSPKKTLNSINTFWKPWDTSGEKVRSAGCLSSNRIHPLGRIQSVSQEKSKTPEVRPFQGLWFSFFSLSPLSPFSHFSHFFLSLHLHREVSLEVVEVETLLIIQENLFDLLLELGAPVSRWMFSVPDLLQQILFVHLRLEK